jgi:uncharacterized membrane protein YbhN (UPF0104 family)
MSPVTLPITAPAPAGAAVQQPWSGGASIREWARRLRVPALVLIAVAAVAILAGGPAQAFIDALRRALEADPKWVAGALGFEVLSFTGYIALLWHVAGRAAPRFGLRESYQTTLAGAAATRLLPTAGAGGAALTLWTLSKAGHRGRHGARTLLTFLVILYAVFLAAIVLAGTAAAISGTGPFALGALPAAGAALAMLIAVGLWLFRPADGEGRVRTGAHVMGTAVGDAAKLVRAGDPRLLGAFAWWGFDMAVLWAAFHAVGAPPAISTLVLGYFLGQVANTIPIPGAASGGLVGVMIASGVAPDVALAAVLTYRAIAIWLPAPAGAHALAGLRRTTARWTAEDAQQPAPAPVVLRPVPIAPPAPACPALVPLAA